MRLTGPLTRRRREAIALAAREQINAATARLQRNVYRDHTKRLAEAIDKMNRATVDRDQQAFLFASQEAAGLVRMTTEYDALQTSTDPTIQGN